MVVSRMRQIFRIEQCRQTDGMQAAVEAERHSLMPADDAVSGSRADEIIAEVHAVRALIEGPAQEAKKAIARLQGQVQEFQKLKSELDVIEGVISQTKQELATIHVGGFQGAKLVRASNELDTVVEDTERATQTILGAVEEIDQCADLLAGVPLDDSSRQQAHQIQDCVVRIFEACNFQDVTGQRITKVVATMKFIEQHIAQMMEIWGGIEAFGEAAADAQPKQDDDAGLLNGPKLAGDAGHVSQDDIDALFG